MKPRLAEFKYGDTDKPQIVTVLEIRMEIPEWSKTPYLHAIIIWPDGRYGLVSASYIKDIGPTE